MKRQQMQSQISKFTLHGKAQAPLANFGNCIQNDFQHSNRVGNGVSGAVGVAKGGDIRKKLHYPTSAGREVVRAVSGGGECCQGEGCLG